MPFLQARRKCINRKAAPQAPLSLNWKERMCLCLISCGQRSLIPLPTIRTKCFVAVWFCFSVQNRVPRGRRNGDLKSKLTHSNPSSPRKVRLLCVCVCVVRMWLILCRVLFLEGAILKNLRQLRKRKARKKRHFSTVITACDFISSRLHASSQCR